MVDKEGAIATAKRRGHQERYVGDVEGMSQIHAHIVGRSIGGRLPVLGSNNAKVWTDSVWRAGSKLSAGVDI